MRRRSAEHTDCHVVEPKCAQCGEDIAVEDVNVKRGVMLCRACGHLTYLDRSGHADPITAAMEVWSPDATPMPRPKRPATRVLHERDCLVLHRRRGSVGGGIFLLLWLIGWSAGTVMLLTHVIAEPSLFMTLFAIPFVVAWFFVCAMMLSSLLGIERLTIGPNGLAYEWRALISLMRRESRLDEITDITGFQTKEDTNGTARRLGLRIWTMGRHIRFGKGLPENELLWLADMIRRQIHTLAPAAIAAARRIAPDADEPAGEAVPAADGVEVLSPRDRFDQPERSTVTLDRRFNALTFARAGWRDFSLGALLGTAAVCLFWNGIVGVFVYGLVSGEAEEDMGSGGFWFLFLFLIPFEAIGLGLLLAFLAVLVQPFTSRRWTFGSEIRVAHRILRLGRTRIIPWRAVSRVELRGHARRRRFWQRGSDGDDETDTCALGLVDLNGEDLLEIDRLTEKEARWIAAELFQGFAGHFARIRD